MSKSSPGSSSGKMKQKNLFSFFASKPPTPSSAKKKPSSTPSKRPSPKKKTVNPLLAKVDVGTRLAVYWEDDDEYYPAVTTGQKSGAPTVFTLLYDDGEAETIDLAGETFKLLKDEKKRKKKKKKEGRDESGGGGEEKKEEDKAVGRTGGGSKRRRIAEESEEEEFEFDDEASSEEEEDDGSVYVDGPQDDDDDEEEEGGWMVTDDDDSAALGNLKTPSPKKKKKTLKVTRVENPYRKKPRTTPEASSASESTPPNVASASEDSNHSHESSEPRRRPPSGATAAAGRESNRFSAFAVGASEGEKDGREAGTPKPTASKAASAAKAASTPKNSAASGGNPASQKVTPTPTQNRSPPPPAAPEPEAGVINPAGSHFHDRLKFLTDPRDSKGRSVDHPEYDPRTLRIDHAELKRASGGKKVSDAQLQWWDLKSKYFDTVLMFKMGKFYEMFHMDADVGVKELGFVYQKGIVAHAGCPEVSYGTMSDELVRRGYKVARVEQTETPEMLSARKKEAPRGKKPSVVNREVCSIMSGGTRTFCYLDDKKLLGEEDGSNGGATGVGPLLSIRELLLPNDDGGGGDGKDDPASGEEGEAAVRPVAEYGVTAVDAVRGTVTIGQFADDVLRSRMNTLLTAFAPTEILIEGGPNGASPTLLSLLQSTRSANPSTRIERIHPTETFPKSTALDSSVRRSLDRRSPTKPWDIEETLDQLHSRGYYPRSSRKKGGGDGGGGDWAKKSRRWPKVLHAAVAGGADLAISSFGAALFYLQRSLIDAEILGMGIVKAYVPPPGSSLSSSSSSSASPATSDAKEGGSEVLRAIAEEQQREEGGIEASKLPPTRPQQAVKFDGGPTSATNAALEDRIDHMSLDGTTLHNLEVLTNAQTLTPAGSLWSKINHTKSPHGSRLLRAWLLRPLFRKADIDRRADAVAELVGGAAAAAMAEVRGALSKCGDVERLLSRVHSMGSTAASSPEDAGGGGAPAEVHPNERAILYETELHTKRKIADFSKLLNGLRAASRIPELFAGIRLESGLLTKLVRTTEEGGCFPAELEVRLDWFFDNFDGSLAAKGLFEPARGMDERYDEACDAIKRIEGDLEQYREEMCAGVLRPKHVARAQWKYVNTKPESKDKYLIELPESVAVPDDFYVKAKRGTGAKQVNKYRTPVVEELVQELEHALDVKNAGKARGMQLVFAKFDALRPLWASAAQATAMLDALGSLAQTSSAGGYSRPNILLCPPGSKPRIDIVQGHHPCVEVTHSGGDFIPNNLSLGGCGDDDGTEGSSRVLLLSGPNMGGKSTLLRQTCLITILAQIGCFVPAESCTLTPIDRIYTRLGASDKILLGQSTFFVELAETAAALRGATRRSLVIMDELGRGTSTFDGTAIAHAAVKHLVERNGCLTLFATHYHSLLADWKDEPTVRLGHMECVVEGDLDDDEGMDMDGAHESEERNDGGDHNITFLYTLGEGACPKSFGINVARLAALPEEVLSKAARVSTDFEAEMNGAGGKRSKVTATSAGALRRRIEAAVASRDWEEAGRLWDELQ